MSAFRNGLVRGGAYGTLAGILIGSVILRFSNPQLTETELFLKYWPAWVIMTISAILSLRIIGASHDR